MVKRWAEAELRFLTDNAEKMSVQALADALSVRVDELEKKMEKLGLLGKVAGAPEPKRAQTLKELSKHTENARKDYDRGVTACRRRSWTRPSGTSWISSRSIPRSVSSWTAPACT